MPDWLLSPTLPVAPDLPWSVHFASGFALCAVLGIWLKRRKKKK